MRTGSAEALRAEVETHLATHEAPELRALYAGTLCPWERALGESERACHARRTPFTLYQFARLHPDPAEGTALLREAVGIAERLSDPYAMVRGGSALTSKLIHAGHYREAVHWGEWVMTQWQEAKLNDPLRHMLIVNDLAYARLLCGELHGLSDLLSGRDLDEMPSEVAQLYQGTLGDYHLARGDVARALVHYRANYDGAARPFLGLAAVDLVRGLLGAGEADAALEVAERACYLTRGEAEPYHQKAQLALGMAHSKREPGRAEELLYAAFKSFETPLQAHRLAQTGLHLAWVKLQLGNRGGAKRVLNTSAGLDELSGTGFRLLFAHHDAAADLWELVQSRAEPLELYVLGRGEVWLEGRRTPMRLRELEILLLLTLNPGGLTLERLHQRLGEPGSRGGTKTAVSRLRQRLPISAAPYRLELGIYADFLALARALKRGEFGAALLSYRGELLAESSAPGVTEARTALEVELQAAVLASRDVGALLSLAEHAEDDLKLWETAPEWLSTNDSRAPIVRARVQHLRRAWER